MLVKRRYILEEISWKMVLKLFLFIKRLKGRGKKDESILFIYYVYLSRDMVYIF